MSAEAPPRPHGRFLAKEVGLLAGVSGTRIGQWARWGYIKASQSDGDPHVYSVEDVLEAAMVGALLRRGVRRADIRAAVAALDRYGPWPLSEAELATNAGGRRPRVIVCEADGASELGDRGWQRLTAPPRLEPVRLRLQRSSR